MQKNEIRSHIKKELIKRPEILFAYLFGSVLDSENPKDIDIGIYISDLSVVSKSPLYEIKISNDIERVINLPVDVILMNNAPHHLIYEISKGEVILNNDDDARIDFITLQWKLYFDMIPKRREWLREATR